MPGLLELVRRRWWVIASVMVIAVAAAGVYAWRQRHVYESTTTLYIHPSWTSLSHSTPGALSSEVGLLSYGSLVNTFVSMAESRSMLAKAGGELGRPAAQLRQYHGTAAVPTKSFVMHVSVDGPSRTLVVRLANRLAHVVGTAATVAYPVAELSPLDAASASSLVRPRVKRDLVYGGLAGLILGFLLAALALSLTDERKPDITQSAVPARGAETPEFELPAGRI